MHGGGPGQHRTRAAHGSGRGQDRTRAARGGGRGQDKTRAARGGGQGQDRTRAARGGSRGQDRTRAARGGGWGQDRTRALTRCFYSRTGTNKFLREEGKKERSGRRLLLRISVARSASLHIPSSRSASLHIPSSRIPDGAKGRGLVAGTRHDSPLLHCRFQHRLHDLTTPCAVVLQRLQQHRWSHEACHQTAMGGALPLGSIPVTSITSSVQSGEGHASSPPGAQLSRADPPVLAVAVGHLGCGGSA